MKRQSILNRELSNANAYQSCQITEGSNQRNNPILGSQELQTIRNTALKTHYTPALGQYSTKKNGLDTLSKYINIQEPQPYKQSNANKLDMQTMPFNNLKTQYEDYRHKNNEDDYTIYSLDPLRRQPRPQLFSYFYHDMEKEEKEYVLPKKQEQPTCKTHKEPVVMYSYPYHEFICQKCYEMLYDKKDCYALSDLEKPMEMLYGTLMQYIEYGREPKLQRQIQDHKAYLEQVKEERYKYLTVYEKALLDKEIMNILYDLQMFWKKIEDMQIQYRNLRQLNDFETIILMYDRWSSICYDFKDKYLNFDYLKTLVDRRIDPIMRPIALKVGICYMCMKNPAILTCNNIKDEQCKICKECANFCTNHGYYCRMHAAYYGDKMADKSYFGNSCEMCKYENIKN